MPLKVAVVGAGSMGMNHLRVLKDFPEEQAVLVGVAEPMEAPRARAMARFQIPGWADYREMITELKPDILAVVVPTHLHYEIASYALDAGVHVLVEKPIASTIEEAEALIDLAKVRGVKLAVGHVERFNPAVIELKKQLAAGHLGRIFYLHARRLGPFPPRIRDVGVILDLATHDMDVMRYLSGAEVEHLFAETQQRVHQTNEDLVLGLIRFSNGSVGMLDVNWLTPTKVRELTVTGERGMYQVNYLTQDLYFFENDYTVAEFEPLRTMAGVSEGTMTRLKLQKSEPLRLEWENIVAAVRDGTSPTVTGQDGLAVLRLAHQLIRAAQSKEVIPCTTAVTR
jgi:predicted dehydrogenase